MLAQRAFLIERLSYTREGLEAALADAPTDREIYKGWTIKQLMDHIAGWDDVIIEALQTHAHNEPVKPTVLRGINAYNAQTTTSRESLSLEQSRSEFHTTRLALIQALNELPDEKFNAALTFPWGESGTVAYLIEIFVEHEEHHGSHVRQWLKNPDEVIGEH